MDKERAKGVQWTAIVLTCPKKEWAHILQEELEVRQKKGYIDKNVFLLTVEDPKEGSGSGGATINALLTVAEYISAQRGYSVLNADVLLDSKILILHHGRSYAYDSCGRAFTTLPAKYKSPEYDGLFTMLDVIIKVITEKIALKAAPGVWVSSTDMILTIPHDTEIPWVACDACAITVPALPSYCRHHGVYKLDSQGIIQDILYKESIENLSTCERPDGTVPIVCGLVYFSRGVAEKLLSFYSKPPLDACTYFGVDSGQPPIQLSLFFDVMLAMCPGVNERDFRSGQRSGTYGKDTVSIGDIKMMRQARTILWKDLHEFRIRALMIDSGNCLYPHTIQEHKKNVQQRLMEPCLPPDSLVWSNITHSCIQSTVKVDSTACVINSLLEGGVTVGSKSLITNCHIHGDVHINNESFISGVVIDEVDKKTLKKKHKLTSISFQESIIVQGFNIYITSLEKNMYVLTTHGRFDDVLMPMWKSTSSFCNDPWLFMFNRSGIIKEDLWGQDIENEDQTILTAKMFPVMHAIDRVGLLEILWLQGAVQDESGEILNRWRNSWRLSLQDILKFTSLRVELDTRRELFFTVSQKEIAVALKEQRNIGFRHVYNSAVVEGYCKQLMETLDAVGEAHTDSLQAGVAARTLANIADILGCMAGPKGGLRSGPAANTAWAKAFSLLESRNIGQGVSALAKERCNWLDRPDKLIRAARHYEGAAQILIRHAVMTAKKFFQPTQEELPPMGQWILAECPARIDVSGGWSDTPPITYEHGGAVTIVALFINGKRPIGAKTRRINEPKLVLVLHGSSDKNEVICQELTDLEDYCQPNAPGALLKAAFICAEIIDMKSELSLKDQLLTNYGGGFELHSWTNLPHGSGLGTSSILAGAVMASLLKAAGKFCDTQGLIHCVLYLEQLLTTGGGWQDQVGGLGGAVKLGLSEGQLPLFVDAVDLRLRPEIIQDFNDRIVLVYTGKTRLARNLLQDVVRNWYARNPQIVETEDSLVELATTCSKYFIDGNLDAVGKCMDLYWKLKKVMAPGCETECITKLMNAFHSHASGICMAGAGGGGFMYVLAKDAVHRDQIKDLVAQMDGSEGIKVYDACIDMEGLKVTVEESDKEATDTDKSQETVNGGLELSAETEGKQEKQAQDDAASGIEHRLEGLKKIAESEKEVIDLAMKLECMMEGLKDMVTEGEKEIHKSEQDEEVDKDENGIVEEQKEEDEESDQEDMADYYNQPEILTDEERRRSEERESEERQMGGVTGDKMGSGELRDCSGSR